MKKTEKADVIAEIKDMLQSSTAVFLVDYHGINVEAINSLRGEFIKEDVKYKVYKNTLFTKAVEELGGYNELIENNLLTGMTGFAFAGDNFVAPAKIIRKFWKDSKDKNLFSLKGCYIDSTFYGGDQIEALASMPTKEEIMAGIVGSIAAPASGIVGAINAVMRDLVSVVDQISKKDAA